MTIVVAILGFMMGFLVCHLWEDKVGEETYKEILKAMQESAEAVKNSPQYDFSCVTSLFGEEEHEDWHRTTEWHKDSDETPNDAKRYLVFRNSESGRRSFCIGWYDCTHDGDLLWHEDDGNYIIWDVIYWTELPEEPHEKGAE